MTPQEIVRMKEIRLWLVVLMLIGMVIGVGLTELFHAVGLNPFVAVIGALVLSFGAAVINSRR